MSMETLLETFVSMDTRTLEAACLGEHLDREMTGVEVGVPW